MKALLDIPFNFPEIEAKLQYIFNDKKLLALAFVHRSYVNEHKEVNIHNERLEFLGDSILGLIACDFLYHELPETAEGELSYLRSRLVEASSCNQYMQKIQVESYLLLGKGEKRNDGRGRESILADLFEAIIGAIYLDGGIAQAKVFMMNHFREEMLNIIRMPLKNWKAALQDFCQKNFQQTPTYQVLSEKGPDHSKLFLVSVQSGGKELGQGEGTSKKIAQQAAAANALLKMGESS